MHNRSNYLRYFLALVAILTCTIAANAQRNPNMKVQLPASPSTEVAVKTILPEDFPAIDKAAFVNVHPASFVLTNQSDRAIVALAVKWSVTSEDGAEAQHLYTINSLSIKNAKPLVQAHTRLFVGPNMALAESLAFAPHIGPRFEALDGRSAPWAAAASQISSTIDVIIFEDGELVGPNHSQYDGQIQSKKLAADQVASEVRQVQSKGQDPTPMLKQIAGATLASPTDFIGLWSGLYAQQLLKAQGAGTFEDRLSALEQTPAPLKMFRKAE
jgi:hypothetical protein